MGQPLLAFEVDGDVEVRRGFSRFADDVKDLSPAFKEIVKDFHRGEEKQFESGGHYGAGGWKPLAPTTIERKVRGGFPLDILVRTGELKTSLVGGGSYGIEEVEKLSMRVGTSLEYGLYHQRGTSRMPARPVIRLSEEQKTAWHKIIHRYLVQKSKEAF